MERLAGAFRTGTSRRLYGNASSVVLNNFVNLRFDGFAYSMILRYPHDVKYVASRHPRIVSFTVFDRQRLGSLIPADGNDRRHLSRSCSCRLHLHRDQRRHWRRGKCAVRSDRPAFDPRTRSPARGVESIPHERITECDRGAHWRRSRSRLRLLRRTRSHTKPVKPAGKPDAVSCVRLTTGLTRMEGPNINSSPMFQVVWSLRQSMTRGRWMVSSWLVTRHASE
jgi:hypothetical protein